MFAENALRKLLGIFIRHRMIGYKGMIRSIKNRNNGIGTIIASNHPSYIDPIILLLSLLKDIDVVPVIGENIYVKYKRLLEKYNPIVVPSFVLNSSELKKEILDLSKRSILKTLREKKNILIYPSAQLQRIPGESVGDVSFLKDLIDSTKCNVYTCNVTGAWNGAFSRKHDNSDSFIKKILMQAYHFVGLSDENLDDEIKFYFKPLKMSNKSISKEEFNEMIENALKYEGVEDKENKVEIDVIFKKFLEDILKDMGHDVKVHAELDLEENLGIDSIKRASIAADLAKRSGVPFMTLMSKVKDIYQDFVKAKGSKDIETKKIIDDCECMNDELHECNDYFVKDSSNVIEAFYKMYSDRPNTICVSDNGNTYTYKDILHKAISLSSIISKRRPKDKYIGVLMPLCGFGLISFFAVIISGKIPVMMGHKVSKLGRSIKALKIKLIISSYEFGDMVFVDMNKNIYSKMLFLESLTLDMMDIDSIKDIIFKNIDFDVLNNEVACIMFTSGSSGSPKIVPITHKAISSNILGSFQRLDISDGSIISPVFTCLPIFHAYGLVSGLLLPVLLGVPVVLVSNPIAYNIPDIIAGCKFSFVFSIPTIALNWVQNGLNRKIKQPKKDMNFVMGAELLTNISANAIKKYFNCKKIYVGYGLTECSPVVSLGIHSNEGNVGKPISKIQIRISNKGEVLVAGSSVFNGYLFSKNKNVFKSIDGVKFFSTKDLGIVNDIGEIVLHGRSDRVIKIKGEKISLEQVESYLKHKFSADCCVVSINVDDSKNNNEVYCFFSKSDISFNDVRKEVSKRFSFMLDDVFYIEKMPLVSSGKTDIEDVIRIASFLRGKNENK